MARQLTAFEKQCARAVGGAVQKMRLRKGASRIRVGSWIGQSADAVAKAERGERRFSVADLIRLSLEFECEMEDLIFSSEETFRIGRART